MSIGFITKKYEVIIKVFIASYVIYHFVTLGLTPLVWVDETIFNAITLDFIKNKTFRLSSCTYLMDGREHLYYGPVYFILNAVPITLFGNHAIANRLLGLISGLSILWLITNRVNKQIFTTSLFLIIASLFLDPFLNTGFHRGRNDLTALLFYFLAWFSINKKERTAYHFAFAGLFFALSVLTTVRMLFFVIPIVFYFLYQFIYRKEERIFWFKGILIFSIVSFSIYMCWILYAFGSIDKYINYYLYVNSVFKAALFGYLFVPPEVYPLLIVTVCFVLLSVLINRITLKNPDVIFYASYILCYFIFIGDSGPYSVLLIPICYLLIIYLIPSIVNSKFSGMATVLSMLLFSFSISIFALKMLTLLITYPSRSYDPVNQFVTKHIPAHSKVAADEVYYYALVNNDCAFQYMHIYIADIPSEDVIVQHRTNVFKYEYLFVSDRIVEISPNIVANYMKYAPLEKVARYETPKLSILNKLAAYTHYTFSRTGYNGTLYRRVSVQQ